MWRSRNPDRQAAPPYLRLEHLNTVRDEMQSGLIDDLRERFPRVDLARIEVQAGDKLVKFRSGTPEGAGGMISIKEETPLGSAAISPKKSKTPWGGSPKLSNAGHQ